MESSVDSGAGSAGNEKALPAQAIRRMSEGARETVTDRYAYSAAKKVLVAAMQTAFDGKH